MSCDEADEPRFSMRVGRLLIRSAWALVIIGVLEVGIGVGLALLRAGDPRPFGAVLIVLHLLFALAGCGLVAVGLLNRHLYLTAETRLTAEGVINRELRTRLVRWQEIADIRMIRRGRYWRTSELLNNGRRKILIAPTTKISAPDPGFEQDVATVQHWWRRHRGG